jgi:putative colanic acid biosynthesis acetyltransferase WcaF
MNDRLYVDNYTIFDKIVRMLWRVAQGIFIRPFRGIFFNRWRLWVLRKFGARIGKGCKIAATATIWAPWNLTLGDYVCIADGVDCYSADKITLQDYVTVSQRAYLCAASHDITILSRPLIASPIIIEKHAWVCAEAYIGAGVTVQEGAIVAARSVVVRSPPPWSVVAGNPARKVKDRIITKTS